MIKLALILLTTLLSDAPDSLEQKACDYFFDNIFRQEYQHYKVIEFQNQTDASDWNIGIVHQCKNWNQAIKGQIISSTPANTVDIKANTADVRVKKIEKNSRRLKVYVHSNIKVGDSYFVSITIYRKLRFADHYFIEFDNDGNIIHICETGEII